MQPDTAGHRSRRKDVSLVQGKVAGGVFDLYAYLKQCDMNKENKYRVKPGPAAEEIKWKIKRMKLHELTTLRLSGQWERRGVLAVDEEGVRHLITDTGKALEIGAISLECQEPLSALAQLVHRHKLVLLDNLLFERDIVLSRTEAVRFMKVRGLRVADSDGNLYRWQDGKILAGSRVTELPDGVFMPETALLYFKSLDTQPMPERGQS